MTEKIKKLRNKKKPLMIIFLLGIIVVLSLTLYILNIVNSSKNIAPEESDASSLIEKNHQYTGKFLMLGNEHTYYPRAISDSGCIAVSFGDGYDEHQSYILNKNFIPTQIVIPDSVKVDVTGLAHIDLRKDICAATGYYRSEKMDYNSFGSFFWTGKEFINIEPLPKSKGEINPNNEKIRNYYKIEKDTIDTPQPFTRFLNSGSVPSIRAYAMNNSFWVVGTSDERAFLWTKDKGTIDFQAILSEQFPQYNIISSNASDINDNFVIVGDFVDENYVNHAYIMMRRNSQNDDLSYRGELIEGYDSYYTNYYVSYINNKNEVLGFMFDSEYILSKNFLFKDGQFTVIEDKITDMDFTFLVVFGFNDNTDIVLSALTYSTPGLYDPILIPGSSTGANEYIKLARFLRSEDFFPAHAMLINNSGRILGAGIYYTDDDQEIWGWMMDPVPSNWEIN